MKRALCALTMLGSAFASLAHADQPVIALGRDAPVVIDGVKQTVEGWDTCPDGTPGCVTLTGRKSIDVRLSSGVTERWAVKWSADGQRVSLTRPNGQSVIQP